MSVVYLKIHKRQNGAVRYAHVEATNGVITAASPALAFMISWKVAYVHERVEAHGFKITTMVRGSRNTTFVTERPSIAERKAARSQA